MCPGLTCFSTPVAGSGGLLCPESDHLNPDLASIDCVWLFLALLLGLCSK